MNKVRLGDVAEVITKGTTPTSIGYGFQDYGINFIKIESLAENGNFLKDKFAHISSECNESLKRSQLKCNDLLFSIAGAIGRVAIVDDSVLPANTNQALAIIRIPEGIINYNYLYYFLKSEAVIKQYSRKKQGVAQINLSLKDISDLILSVPSLSQQNKIVKTLSFLDDLIKKANQQKEKLDELIKSRFVEMFGDINEYCDVGYYIKALIAGKSLAGEEECENKVLKTGAASYDFFDATQVKNLPLDYVPQYEHLVNVGDIIISRMNTAELTGAAAYVWNVPEKVYLPDRLWKAVLQENCNPIFLWQILILPSTKEQIRRECSGTSGSMKNISKLGMLAIRVKKVPIIMQNQFADFVTQVEKQKATVQQSIDKLETIKKSLMQEYFG